MTYSVVCKAQTEPCGTPSLTYQELLWLDSLLQNQSNRPESAFIWNIPVRFTVCLKDDGSGFPSSLNAAFLDDILSDMNAELNLNPNGNTFNFYRCAPVNFINSTQLHNGTLEVEDYSMVNNFLNFYIRLDPIAGGGLATYPSNQPMRLWLDTPPFYSDGTTNPNFVITAIHEMGHTIGLGHTHGGNQKYVVPVTPSQQDYPYGDLAESRELAIRVNEQIGSLKQFQLTNFEDAGDRVEDTPPGCVPGINARLNFPSVTMLTPGCFDDDASTPCINQCDVNPANCINGCKINAATCTYEGDYADYNGDVVQDAANIIVRNYMS